MIGYAGGAHDGNIAIGKTLQSPVEYKTESIRQDGMAEERKWPEPERLVSHLEQTSTPQGLFDLTSTVVYHFWQRLRESHPPSYPRQHGFHALPEWRKGWIKLWVEQIRQSCPIGGGEQHMATWPDHASHLLNGQLGLPEPGQEADRDHEVEGTVFEHQGIDIADIYFKQVSNAELGGI